MAWLYNQLFGGLHLGFPRAGKGTTIEIILSTYFIHNFMRKKKNSNKKKIIKLSKVKPSNIYVYGIDEQFCVQLSNFCTKIKKKKFHKH
jgi:hypothetical protein